MTTDSEGETSKVACKPEENEGESVISNGEEDEAAMKIQQAWRKTPQGESLSADVRWSDAALAARLEVRCRIFLH